MQHGRNTSAPFTEWDSYEWAGVDRQRAVETLGDQIIYAVLQDEERITLPRHAAQVIHSCAKDGARKGRWEFSHASRTAA
jgi:hypothetical protein